MTAVTQSRAPAVGDSVSHEGDVAGFRITALIPRFNPDSGAPVTVAVFEHESLQVACVAAELVWLDEDQAWHLPGRLLSGAERDLWAAHHGGAPRNRPEDHVAARATLRSSHAEDHRAILANAAQVRQRRAQQMLDKQELRQLRKPVPSAEQVAAAQARRAPKEG